MSTKALSLLLLLLSSGIAHSYEVDTHREMSRQAALASNLSSFLPVLGLADLDSKLPSNTSAVQPWILSVACLEGFGSGQRSVLELIQLGTFCEDATLGGQALARYFNHFFDPAHNGAGYLGTFPSSLAWGMEPTAIGSQDYSYRDARNYLYSALVLPAKADRDANMALTFRTLGHVIHLVQDLAQPQHTRNDSHAAGSLYEQYTKHVRTNLTFSGYAAVQVTTPDRLWHTVDNKGLADYSNRGFVSAETNFRGTANQIPPNILPNANYPLPDGSGAQVDVEQITDLLGLVGPTQPLVGQINFISTRVPDNQTGASDTNLRTSTFSLFDEDLAVRGFFMVFTLNRFNFDEAHKLLLPRAVGYSAGLINYFFRGQMEITLPDEGVYAITDYANGAQGFNKVKLKLQNTTPGDAMSAGSVVAVVKFHRNICHTAALSSELGTGNPNSCHSPDEEIVVSAPGVDAGNAPITAVPTADDNPNGIVVSFDFGAHPIPFAATDVSLQVVYRGTLGEEVDAVAVASKDISEPSYFALANYTDYYYWLNDNSYRPGNPDVVSNIELSLAGDSGPIVARLSTLNGGQDAQLAWLSDKGWRPWAMNTTSVFGNVPGRYVYASQTGLGEDAQTFGHIPCPYYRNRGVYRDYLVFFLEEHGITGIGTTSAQVASGQATDHGKVITAGTLPSSAPMESNSAMAASQPPPGLPACPDGTGIMNDTAMTPLGPALNWTVTF